MSSSSSLWVRSWNYVASQTEIRVVNHTPYSFRVQLSVGGITYQDALLPSASLLNQSKNPKKASKTLFSSVKLTCGYFWYCVSAQYIQELDPVVICEDSLNCLIQGMYGGSTVHLKETSKGSKVVYFDTIEPEISLEASETEESEEIEGIETKEGTKEEIVEEQKNKEESKTSIESNVSKQCRQPADSWDTESKEEEAQLKKNNEIPKAFKNASGHSLNMEILNALKGLWIVDTSLSEPLEELLLLKGMSYIKRKAAKHITQRQKISPACSTGLDDVKKFEIKNIAGPVTQITEVEIGSKEPILTPAGEKVLASFAKPPERLQDLVLGVCVKIDFTFPNGDSQSVHHGISKTDKNEKHMIINYKTVAGKRAQVHTVWKREKA